MILQGLLCPGLHIEPVDATTCHILRHFGYQQKRTPARLRNLEQHSTHHAHELGSMNSLLPLLPRRQARHVAGEVDLDAIEVIVLRLGKSGLLLPLDPVLVDIVPIVLHP